MTTTIATVSAKTYKAALQSDGTCIVSGLHARDIAGGCDTGRASDRQRALRAEIQAKLYAVIPYDKEDRTAGSVIEWSADL